MEGKKVAKSIAASHAGLSVSDVVFSKVKLEREDDSLQAPVEFSNI